MKWLVAVACIALALVTTVQARNGNPYPNAGSPLGTNLALGGGTISGGEQPFLNIVKTAQGWAHYNNSNTQTTEASTWPSSVLDANGYPTCVSSCAAWTGGTTRLGFPVLKLNSAAATFYYSSVFPSGSTYYPIGHYEVQWTGTAHLAFASDGSGSCTSSPCDLNITSSTSSGILVLVTCTTSLECNGSGSSSDHITSLSMVFCGSSISPCTLGYDSLLAGGQRFDPTFLARMQPFRAVRFMQSFDILESWFSAWSQRPQDNWPFWQDTDYNINAGAPSSHFNSIWPIEEALNLCIAIHADCWLNMPLLATDDFITQAATLAHNMLKGTGLNVYVEFGNEMWLQEWISNQDHGSNGMSLGVTIAGVVNTVLPTMSTAGADGTGGTKTYGWAWGTLRAIQSGMIWKSVWGSDSAHVFRVLGGQGTNEALNVLILGMTQSFLVTNGGYSCTDSLRCSQPNFTGTAAANSDVFAAAMYFWPANGQLPVSWTADADGGKTKIFQEIFGPNLLPTSKVTGDCSGTGHPGLTCGPTGGAYTITTNLSLSATPANGTCIRFQFNSAESGTAVTIAADGGTAFNLQQYSSGSVANITSTVTGSDYTACLTSATNAGSVSPAVWITAGNAYTGGLLQQATDGHACDYAAVNGNALTNGQCSLSSGTNYGLPVVGYEMGQQFLANSGDPLQTAFQALMRDARMSIAYNKLRNADKTIGITMGFFYNDILPFDTFGSGDWWGALENIWQPTSPRYDGEVNFGHNGCWWGSTAPWSNVGGCR